MNRFSLPLLCMVTFLSMPMISMAQSVGIGATTFTPDSDALLELRSTTKGFLAPRMTDAEITTFTSAANSGGGLGTAEEGMTVFNTTTDKYNFWDGSAWQEIGTATGGNTLDQSYDQGGAGLGRTIDASDGAVRINGADGLIVTGTYGSGDVVEVTGAGTRMFFNPRRAAFRAGNVSGTQWDDSNIGDYSVAMGRDATASATYTTGIGYGAAATEDYATALGYANTASGAYSMALGKGSTASGWSSATLGDNSTASGSTTVVVGSNSTASAYQAMVLGNFSTASGNNSTAMGTYTTAKSGYEMVVGRYNTDYTPNSTTAWDAADRLFTVGNGTSSAATSDALTILKNGNIGIGTSSPTQLLHLSGTAGTDGIQFPDGTVQTTAAIAGSGNTLDEAYDEGGSGAGRTLDASDGAVRIDGTDGLIITGTQALGDMVEVSGAGTRMFYNPRTAAFRAGGVNGTQWDHSNLGIFSFASGYSTIASEDYSFAHGQFTEATGQYSIAMGSQAMATANQAVAIGSSTTASDLYALALGQQSTASGRSSVSIGQQTVASNNWSIAMGYLSQATEDNAVAVGKNNVASGESAVAFGDNSTASGDYSVASGYSSTASGGYAVALGRDADASGAYSLAGSYATASAVSSSAFGYQADASGNYAHAMGRNADASGIYSLALGFNSESTMQSGVAIGEGASSSANYAVALGRLSDASGTESLAMKGGTASGNNSTAIGGSTASGAGSVVIGGNNSATQSTSMVFGNNSTASGAYALALGGYNNAVGDGSTTLGRFLAAGGTYSTAIGYYTTAVSRSETVLGQYNTLYAGNATSWVPTDRLFVVGNGTNTATRSNALTILKNGNTGIGTDTPTQLLHLSGTAGTDGIRFPDGTVQTTAAGIANNNTLDEAYDQGGAGNGRTIEASDGAVRVNGDDGLIVTGTFGSGDAIETTGAGTRMFFNPNKDAFRMGTVTGTQWDNANLGNHSVAMGRNTMASGGSSLAIGEGSSASGYVAVALGQSNNATAQNTFAAGYGSDATGIYSTSIGFNNVASGDYSSALGSGSLAESFSEFVVGSYSHDYTPNSTSSWDTNDRIFAVGNGQSLVSRSNALTILKSGNTGIGTHQPSATLDVEGTFQLVDGNEGADKILTSDANGNAAWEDPRYMAIVPLWNSETGAGYVMNNGAGADLSNCEAGLIPSAFSTTGDVQIKMVVMVTAASGTNNFQCHSEGAFPITNTDTWNWHAQGTGWVVESQWKNWSAGTTPREVHLYGWNSSGGSATFTNAYLMVRSQ